MCSSWEKDLQITGSSDRVKCCVASWYKPFQKQQILLDYLKMVLNQFEMFSFIQIPFKSSSMKYPCYIGVSFLTKNKHEALLFFSLIYSYCWLEILIVSDYSFGIKLSQRVDNCTLITFNARNDHDRCKFAEDMRESISEMDEMESLRIEGELERQKNGRGGRWVCLVIVVPTFLLLRFVFSRPGWPHNLES